MLTLNDGRSELWQWDTGRTLTVDADCSQVHFSNKVFGRSIDVDVVDGIAIIPDILLQTDKELTAWAFVGTAENGYTKISKAFKVNRRNKPADYVFTPHDQTTLGEIVQRLDDLEAIQDPDAIKNAVDDYLANNLIQIDEKDPTVPAWAKQETKPKYTATEVGAVATINGVKPDANGNVEIEVSGQNGDQSGMSTELKTALVGYFTHVMPYFDDTNGLAYVNAVLTALGAEIRGESGEETPDAPVIPDEPDEPEQPEKTLTGISAVYSGGPVPVGTAVSVLTGVVVTAHYSDGSTATVTGYTLSGTIAEGNNTITVAYGGKTATISVVGVSESGGGSDIPAVVNLFDKNTMVTEDYFIGTNGVPLKSNGSKYATVPVSANTTYALQKSDTYSVDQWGSGGNGCPGWYDSEMNLLSVVNMSSPNFHADSSGKGIKLTSPESAAFICLSLKVNASGTDYTDTFMIEVGDTCHDYVEYAS